MQEHRVYDRLALLPKVHDLLARGFDVMVVRARPAAVSLINPPPTLVVTQGIEELRNEPAGAAAELARPFAPR